ncbi:MAG: EAL domain-containing protein [Comamonas sp.]|nr:EAL domain-containing protein [Comamonas sp.]
MVDVENEKQTHYREVEWLGKKFPKSDRAIKIRILLQLNTLVCTVLGIFWAICYSFFSRIDLAFIFLALFLVGVCSYFSAKKFSYHYLVGIAHALLLIVTAISLIDSPIEDVPRSAHVYFLPLAIGVVFVFNHKHKYMGIIFPRMCLMLFAIFGVGFLDMDVSSISPPENIRWIGCISNYLFSMMVLACILKLHISNINEKVDLAFSLAQAVSNNEIVVHYQIQVDKYGNPLGAEALVRWMHRERGLLSPDKFIPLAEESFLIRDIGLEVLRQSCELLQKWSEDPLLQKKYIAVNVSPVQLIDDGFVSDVIEVVKAAGVDPGLIELELTESALSMEAEKASLKIQQLRDFGIRWALDDFGSGFSSLAILKSLPVQKIKIDRQFIKDAKANESSKNLLKKILEISELMGMEAIVEGVEDQSQHAMLVDLGYAQFQGYFFGRPKLASDLTDSIRSSKS